ncbi:MAG: protein-glutamate O-methyltransferase CheR [Herpetosiphonaceae bacterium]|nr:protein-glutamate O-methyltransferase CheR [Herpetosiphonaceae bacterium]
MTQHEREDIELDLLLEGISRYYGYDFRHYAPASLKRRIWAAIRTEQLASISALQEQVLHDPACMERLLLSLTVNVTTMFRDPEFYRIFREKVVPRLRTYPFIRIWHAGCSTGEEVYSMAILLHEEGLYDRCRIYATDINERVLSKARSGIFDLSTMQEYTQNYLRAGGTRSFSEYYTAAYDHALFNPRLKEQITFSQHNLATDGSFNEFNVVLCRNVLIYFNKQLQERVHNLMYESLGMFGVLGIGRAESMRFTSHEQHYKELHPGERLYQRVV